jgi:prepilin-type N-terminal cleavage/methylation domain-containing protein
MKRAKRAPRRVAMTLIELVVAMTIVGMVSAAGFASFSFLVDNRSRVLERHDAVARAVAIRGTLGAWIGGIESRARADSLAFRGMHAMSHGFSDDDVAFFTSARTAVNEWPVFVRLFVGRRDQREGGSQTGGATLDTEAGLVAELTDPETLATTRVRLDSTVTGLAMRYLDATPNPNVWLTSWISDRVIPAAVEIVLTVAPPDTLPTLLRLPITAPIGQGR